MCARALLKIQQKSLVLLQKSDRDLFFYKIFNDHVDNTRGRELVRFVAKWELVYVNLLCKPANVSIAIIFILKVEFN